MRRILAVGLISAFLAGSVRAATFSIDSNHSSVSFRVKHIVGKVTGHFARFSGTFDYDPANLAAGSAQATLQAQSIDTGIEKRDKHLRSPDYFDVQTFPTLTFKGAGVTDVQGSRAKLRGDLTLHGVTRPVVLDLELAGVVKDPMGTGQRAGVTATTTINRNDFLVGPASGPTAAMVGNEVEITIELEGVSQ